MTIEGYQQSESKKYKSKDPKDVLRRQQNTLLRRMEQEEKEHMAAMKRLPPSDLYRTTGRAPAQVPGSIVGPRMPGYEVVGGGYMKKKEYENFTPGVSRAQSLISLLDERLTPEVE